MSQKNAFHPLTVTDIEKTIRDAVVVTLKADDPEAFTFTQGQYLTFRRSFDGEEVRRSYSICTAPKDGILQVGIKRVDGGAFSTWANNDLAIGERVEAMRPAGNFYGTQNVDDTQPHYLAFAGGSGITPVLSILRTALSEEPNCSFTLVYANRNVNTIMFRDELEDLKNLYLGRLSIIHVLEDESSDIDLFRGRVDAEKCAALFKSWIDVKAITTTYICGPEPMMLAISGALKDHGVAKENIRFELFASNQPGRAPRQAQTSNSLKSGVSGKVSVDGKTIEVSFASDISLLEAAIENNLDAPFGCRAGVCSTCKARIIEGEVEMLTNHALEDYEVERGYVLSCQSYPVSDRIVWEYED